MPPAAPVLVWLAFAGIAAFSTACNAWPRGRAPAPRSATAAPPTPASAGLPTAQGAEPPVAVIAAPEDRGTSFRLDDGWRIDLAPRSSLRLAAGYGPRHRVVLLEGEAAITVTGDSPSPLVVRTGAMTVVARDVDARFVVRADPADTMAHVSVAEGVVLVTNDSAMGDSLLVGGGGRARGTRGGLLALIPAPVLDSAGHGRRQLVFEGNRLGDVLPHIERAYGVRIDLVGPAELGDRHLFASFQDSDVDVVLRAVATALDLEVVRTKCDHFLLTEKDVARPRPRPLVLCDAPVPEAVVEIGRRWDLVIDVADSALLGHRITVELDSDDKDAGLSMIAAVLGARFERQVRHVRLTRGDSR